MYGVSLSLAQSMQQAADGSRRVQEQACEPDLKVKETGQTRSSTASSGVLQQETRAAGSGAIRQMLTRKAGPFCIAP